MTNPPREVAAAELGRKSSYAEPPKCKCGAPAVVRQRDGAFECARCALIKRHGFEPEDLV